MNLMLRTIHLQRPKINKSNNACQAKQYRWPVHELFYGTRTVMQVTYCSSCVGSCNSIIHVPRPWCWPMILKQSWGHNSPFRIKFCVCWWTTRKSMKQNSVCVRELRNKYIPYVFGSSISDWKMKLLLQSNSVQITFTKLFADTNLKYYDESQLLSIFMTINACSKERFHYRSINIYFDDDVLHIVTGLTLAMYTLDNIASGDFVLHNLAWCL